MTSRWLTPTRIGLAGVGALALVGTGALVGAAYTTPAVPAGLQPPVRASAFPVSETSFDDARPVQLEVVRHPAAELTSPASGRVTASTCTPGVPVTSGTSPLSVDGEQIVALSTQTPLWRGLARGDKGDDVIALQQELQRLGYLAAPSGTLDRSTVLAFQHLLTSLGQTPPSSTGIAVDHIVWLPAASTIVDACPVALGSTIEAGDSIAAVPGTLAAVSIIDTPGDLVSGPRLLTIDGTAVAMDPGGTLTDPSALATLEGLPSLRVRADSEEPATAQLTLATPIKVAVVPPSAVIGADEQTCVVADGRALRAEVVGSELGQSFVMIEGTAPTTVEVDPPESLRCE
ncbi:MAG: peptidoglycan-binding protein [Cellulomonadaceae bacterium]|nr:peptidoglycan-binding protein [Cellulomonadaceae bacterium]